MTIMNEVYHFLFIYLCFNLSKLLERGNKDGAGRKKLIISAFRNA